MWQLGFDKVVHVKITKLELKKTLTKCVKTVRVFILTMDDLSRRQAYMRGVQGSRVLGKRKHMSPAAMIKLARNE